VVLVVVYSFGAPSTIGVLIKSIGQVCVAEQIGGLHSGVSQLVGS
jgi:hypothetical protein